MFEFFRQHTLVLKIVLGLVILAFVGGTIYGGFADINRNDTVVVAEVDGKKITRNDWEMVQRDQLERQRQKNPNFDAKQFDTPQVKTQILDAIVRDHVIRAAAEKNHLTVSDDRLQRLFSTDPEFASLRNPNGSINKEALAAQGMSSDVFAQRLAQELAMRQVLKGVTGTVFAPANASNLAFDTMFQQREVQVQRINAKDFVGKVAPTDAEIEAFYKDPKNATQIQAPETAAIEYVVLDLEAVKKNISVADKDLRDHYAANEKRYTTPEERRARHILIKADTADKRAAAKTKAEGLLAELKKNSAQFADLARKNSDDPGSAEKGGDLDFFTRGSMVKPFEDTAFSLKPNELSGLVETQFGFHIIQLIAVKTEEKRSFDAVKAEIDTEVKTQLAQKRFSELAVEFGNMVYEQPDALKPVADKFKLELRTAPDVKRIATGPTKDDILANPKFLSALFGAEALRNKRNTEAVETAPNTLVSGRVLTHQPVRQLPLADVKPRLLERLIAVQAAAQARKAGESRLAELRAAPTTMLAEPAVTVSRAQPGELQGGQLLDAALNAPSSPLPSLVGLDLGDQGYAVVKVNKILGRDPALADATRAQSQYAQTWADAESQAYYIALKSKYSVKIKQNILGVATDAPASSASSIIN
jgi:peptidyl-prolyl cis-trans isomerase D